LLPTSSDQPEGFGRATLNALLFGLAPDGVYQAIPVTRDTGGLLPRLFTLTPPDGGAVSFLWHFPSRHRDWALPSILPCGARTFLPFRFTADRAII